MENALQPESNSQPAPSRPKQELQRVLIPQPMSAKPYPDYLPPKPHRLDGSRIQVTAFYTEHSEIVERWEMSETDVRWYRLEAWKQRWVTLKLDKRTPVA